MWILAAAVEGTLPTCSPQLVSDADGCALATNSTDECTDAARVLIPDAGTALAEHVDTDDRPSGCSWGTDGQLVFNSARPAGASCNSTRVCVCCASDVAIVAVVPNATRAHVATLLAFEGEVSGSMFWGLDCSNASGVAHGVTAAATFTFRHAGTFQLCYRVDGGAAFLPQQGVTITVSDLCIPHILQRGLPGGPTCPRPVANIDECSDVAGVHPFITPSASPARLQAGGSAPDRPHGCRYELGTGALWFNVGNHSVPCSGDHWCVCCSTGGVSGLSIRSISPSDAQASVPTSIALEGTIFEGDEVAWAANCSNLTSVVEPTEGTGAVTKFSVADGGVYKLCYRTQEHLEFVEQVGVTLEVWEICQAGRQNSGQCAQPVGSISACNHLARIGQPGVPPDAVAEAKEDDDRPGGCWFQDATSSLYFNVPPQDKPLSDCSSEYTCLCCGVTNTATTTTATTTSGTTTSRSSTTASFSATTSSTTASSTSTSDTTTSDTSSSTAFNSTSITTTTFSTVSTTASASSNTSESTANNLSSSPTTTTSMGTPETTTATGPGLTAAEYKVVSLQGAMTTGLSYHFSKQAGDMDASCGTLSPNSHVYGVDEGDGWIRVGSRFVPLAVSGEVALAVQGPSPALLWVATPWTVCPGPCGEAVRTLRCPACFGEALCEESGPRPPQERSCGGDCGPEHLASAGLAIWVSGGAIGALCICVAGLVLVRRHSKQRPRSWDLPTEAETLPVAPLPKATIVPLSLGSPDAEELGKESSELTTGIYPRSLVLPSPEETSELKAGRIPLSLVLPSVEESPRPDGAEALELRSPSQVKHWRSSPTPTPSLDPDGQEGAPPKQVNDIPLSLKLRSSEEEPSKSKADEVNDIPLSVKLRSSEEEPSKSKPDEVNDIPLSLKLRSSEEEPSKSKADEAETLEPDGLSESPVPSQEAPMSEALEEVACPKGHACSRMSCAPPGFANTVSCHNCLKTGLGGSGGDLFHCPRCQYNLCMPCCGELQKPEVRNRLSCGPPPPASWT